MVALGLWLGALAGHVALASALDPLAWHRHEMLFGFVGAVVAGFLLTAVPNWTGRLPIAGAPLARLFGLWIAARIGLLTSALTSLWLAALLDVGFFCILAVVAAREVLQAKNRNLPIVGMVLLFALADALDYAGGNGVIAATDLGWRLAVSIMVVLISLIGGRIIPSFTRNWMAKRGVTTGLPTQPSRFDLMVLAATATGLVSWLALPVSVLAAVLLLFASAVQVIRWARWRGYRTFADPLVLILHVGYFWVPVGLTLLGLSSLEVVPRSAAIHALTAGAMATMILAVMTRASLGHTARDLEANGVTVLVYALVTLGALVRVAAALNAIDYRVGIDLAGVAWAGAFLMFIIGYARVLWRPRLGEA